MSKGKVFLTGASGFVGSHVAAELLASNYALKASFRTPAKAAAFRQAFPSDSDKIETVQVPDIVAPGAYAGLLDGCEYVIHCASPYTFAVEDIKKDLIDPAVKGTTEVLEAVEGAATPGVRRVVVTSSFAAVIDPFQGLRKGYTYTEKDWNPMTLDKVGDNKLYGYQASKKLAEKAAWAWVEGPGAKKRGASLVTICPPMVFGPVHPASGITAAKPNESSGQILAAIGGDAAPGQTRLPCFVDVRDVARAHVRALDEGRVPGSERFLVCGGKYTWRAVREVYERGDGGEASEETMREAVEGAYGIDAGKAEEMLGMGPWIGLGECVRDAVASLGVGERAA